jgi:hypothetical protein
MLAVAVDQADGDRARRFLAPDVAVRAAVFPEGLLDHLAQALGALAEERLGVAQHGVLVEGVAVRGLLLLVGGGRGRRAECR